MKKRFLLYLGMMLFALPIFAQDSLKIDFNRTGVGATEAGWDAIELSDKVAFPATYSSFTKFSSTVYVKPVCLPKPAANNYRAIDRTNSFYSDSLTDVLHDWIAADILAGTNDTTTTIGIMLTGLPAGIYALKSYHHDNGDQRSEFTTKIENKAGVLVDDATQTQITQSQYSAEPGYATAFEDVGTYEFGQVVSAGTDDTISVFFTSIYPYRATEVNANQSLKLLLVNGFELTVSSSEAFLSELSLKGTSTLTPAFDKDVFTYDVELPYDYTIDSIPGVIYTEALNAVVDTTRATALPGATTIAVTSQDGTSTVTYTINFTLASAPSSDASLTALSVDGNTLSPVFDAATLTYDVELPYGTTIETLPDVIFTVADRATFDSTNATALPGATTIEVTAEDGTTKQTYTINFTVNATPSTDASLTALSVDGYSLSPEFDAATLTYDVELPYGTTIEDLPGVLFTAAYRATVESTDATVLPGSTTLEVTAEDLTTKQTYTINFTIGLPSSDPLRIDFNRTGSGTETGWEAIEAGDKVAYADTFSNFVKLSSLFMLSQYG